MADVDTENQNGATSTSKKPSLFGRLRSRTHKPYRRAHEANISIHDPSVRTSRIALVKASAKNFVLLQILFFALFCYLFGSLYKQPKMVHNFNIAFVDYDGGSVGASIRAAYQNMRGDGFPSLQEKSPSEYPSPSDLRQAVCNVNYWAALYISPGASETIQNSLAGQTQGYNKSNIMQYIWNEARYSAIVDSDIIMNLELLGEAAKVVYASQPNWTSVIQNPDASTYTTFASPWTMTSDDIKTTNQGARLVYNTLVIILILIQEFFYLGTLNQLYDAFKIYTRLNPHRIIFFRNLISIIYCMMGSLFVTSAIWIFRTGWQVNGTQFVLTWLVLWLFAHVNFLTLDVFTVWLPPPFVPMALVTWLILNVASILAPFELMSDFYRWSYAMPAHEVYQTLIDIWSSGCNPVLRYSLPILFSYEISSFILSALGIHRRCHYAIIRAESERKADSERLAAAMAFEKKARLEERRLAEEDAAAGEKRDGAAEEAEEQKEESEDRAEINQLMEADKERLRKLKSYNFGPSFGFGLTSGNAGGDDGADLGPRRTVG